MNITKWNGKPITKAGWYSGIPIERYHSAGICAGKAVSSSDLRTAWSKSLAHMFDRWAENEAREDRSMTDAMLVGAVAHHLLLGEDGFKLKFVPFPATYRDKKTAEEKKWHNGADVCKAWVAEQTKKGKTPVKIEDLTKIIAMSKSLANEPLVQDGLLKGHVECSGFVRDRETGLWIKVRPDVVPMSGPDFVDLKTAAEVTSVSLMSSIRSYGYHQQGGLIWEACEQLAQPFESFTLMFIESARPFCARTVPLTDDDLARGRMQNRAMLRKIAHAIDAGHWAGPGEGDTRPLPLSNDERDRIDARLKVEGVT
jgi:hypothetical protein